METITAHIPQHGYYPAESVQGYPIPPPPPPFQAAAPTLEEGVCSFNAVGSSESPICSDCHIVRATRFVVSGFPTLLILGPPLLILGPPLLILGPTLLILGPTLLILEPTLLILAVKMGIAIQKKTQNIRIVDLGYE